MLVVGSDDPAFTCCHVLGGIETETLDISRGVDLPAVETGAISLATKVRATKLITAIVV